MITIFKKKRVKNVFPKTTEAAWFALKEFIDPLTCLERHNEVPTPMNKQVVLEHLFSGTIIYENISDSKQINYNLKTYNFSKSRLHEHLMQESVYYYRSKRCAKHTEGYGSSDKRALSLPFSDELNICTKKKKYDMYYVFLGGLDIDAHQGETDAVTVGNWIKHDYLKHTYWEPSTGGKGRHGYYKVAYPINLSLGYITETLTDVYDLLNKVREKLGFNATIDPPCGLPVIFSYDKTVPAPYINVCDLFSRYENCSEEKDNSFEKLGYENALKENDCSLSKFKSSFYVDIYNSESGEYKKLESIKRPVSLHISQCFKIPRFNASSDLCNMNNIISFYNLPYYEFSYFVELKSRLRKELGLQEQELLYKATPNFPLGKGNMGFLEVKSTILVPFMRESEREYGPPIVCTTKGGSNKEISPISTDFISWTDIKNNSNYRNIITDNNNYSKIRNVKTYDQYIAECREITDKLKRTNRFYWVYSVHLKYVPDVKTAIEEYLRLGLNENSNINSRKRKKRFSSTRKLIELKFELDKCGLNLDDWDDNKDRIINYISKQLGGEDLTYNKGANKVLPVKVVELSLIYFAIYKSNKSDTQREDGDIIKNSFSYNMIKEVMTLKFGSEHKKSGGYSKNKAAKILCILQEIGVIEKVGYYIPGTRGTCYKAIVI